MFVSLQDELDFAMAYVDLLKERFDTGLEVEVNIPERFKSRRIIPCGLQLLIENATKHNIVSPETPLMIKIYIEGEHIVVFNNLQLRQHAADTSSGVGLSNIEGQYAAAFNRKIEVCRSSEFFKVEIPLIK